MRIYFLLFLLQDSCDRLGFIYFQLLVAVGHCLLFLCDFHLIAVIGYALIRMRWIVWSIPINFHSREWQNETLHTLCVLGICSCWNEKCYRKWEILFASQLVRNDPVLSILFKYHGIVSYFSQQLWPISMFHTHTAECKQCRLCLVWLLSNV